MDASEWTYDCEREKCVYNIAVQQWDCSWSGHRRTVGGRIHSSVTVCDTRCHCNDVCTLRTAAADNFTRCAAFH